MIDFLKNWSLNIVTIVIFIVLLEMLLPSGKMKKMINLVSGLILVIVLINPVLGILEKGVDLKTYQMANSNFIDKTEIMVNSEVLKEEQTRQITNVYRNKIIDQLECTIKEVKGVFDVKADVIINEDYSSENFGEVKKVYIALKLGSNDENEGVKPVKKIDKIRVETKKSGESKEKSGAGIDKELKAHVEDKIEKLLNIHNENIVISLEED
ncbi:MAG: Stage III sporulation protein AF (Spore_III_AF) [Firmicutes bacterium ADurb.Bin419]|nr:MAG: Stage III sporulation protein AF (Spore_III_AF) [Firmicutes bacterium ADurb.Bin419]